jgi:hypothetical protein
MTDTDFTELVKRKIAERREGRSAAVQAAAEADRRFNTRVASLLAAVTQMIESLSGDSLFANAMGRPEVSVRRDDKDGLEGRLEFKGRAGRVVFIVCDGDPVLVRIYPEQAISTALGCEIAYEAEPIKGDLSRIDDLMLRVWDHLGEFFADIYLSPAAHVLQPESGTSDSLKW